MRRGFLNQHKSQPKPKAGGSQEKAAKKTQAIYSQYPSANNIVVSEDDAKKWAHKLDESQAYFNKRIQTQAARTVEADFQMIFRNLYFSNGFEGVTVADAKIINILPKQFNPRPSALENAYRIAAAPGKSLGMFAARDIPAGALILSEYPLFVFPNIVPLGPSLSRDEFFKMLFDRIKPDVRDRALSLSNSKPREVCGEEEGIVRTNGFMVHLPKAEGQNASNTSHSGTFLDLSRCNHRYVLITPPMSDPIDALAASAADRILLINGICRHTQCVYPLHAQLPKAKKLRFAISI
jgi:hypothetical protein